MIFQRIKNLWRLSELQVTDNGYLVTTQDSPQIKVHARGKMATIIEPDPIEQFEEKEI